MIEDKETGLIVAENKEEEFWFRIKTSAEKTLNEIIPEAFLKLEDDRKLATELLNLANTRLNK